jgi:hypothetical protein
LAMADIKRAKSKFQEFTETDKNEGDLRKQYVLPELIEERQRPALAAALDFLSDHRQFGAYQAEWLRQRAPPAQKFDYGQYVEHTDYFGVLGIRNGGSDKFMHRDVLRIIEEFEQFNGPRRFDESFHLPPSKNPYLQIPLFEREWGAVEQAIIHLRDRVRFERYKSVWREQHDLPPVQTIKRLMEEYIASARTVMVKGEVRKNKEMPLLSASGLTAVNEDLTGINFYRVNLAGMDFRGSVLDLAIFREANIANALFDTKTHVNSKTNLLNVKGVEAAIDLTLVPDITQVMGGKHLFPKQEGTKKVAVKDPAVPHEAITPVPRLKIVPRMSYKKNRKKFPMTMRPINHAVSIPLENFDDLPMIRERRGAPPPPEALPAFASVRPVSPNRGDADRQEALERHHWAGVAQRQEKPDSETQDPSVGSPVITIPEVTDKLWQEILGVTFPSAMASSAPSRGEQSRAKPLRHGLLPFVPST